MFDLLQSPIIKSLCLLVVKPLITESKFKRLPSSSRQLPNMKRFGIGFNLRKSVRYCYPPNLLKKIRKFQSPNHLWQYYHLDDGFRIGKLVLCRETAIQKKLPPSGVVSFTECSAELGLLFTLFAADATAMTRFD